MTKENAAATAYKAKQDAEAVRSTIKDVVQLQATAFEGMSTDLGFDTTQILKYLTTTLIKDHTDANSRLGF